jgi:ADP-ribose pyrophosphatase YjhB (NUDIX family)
MRHLRTTIHSDLSSLDNQVIITRHATRAIVVDKQNILLLYTERYNDYTLPGGGLNEKEDPIGGMIRELEEETGAKNISMIQDYGIYEEFRPWSRDNADVLHMISHCYTCKIDHELGQNRLEEHEVRNGMTPVWIDIHQAIRHNEETMASSDKKGLSIERETFLLRKIVEEFNL